MSKTTKTNGYQVVVTPEGNHWSQPTDRPAAERAKCDHIAAGIRRHVDAIGRVSVEPINHDVCSHCGRIWTEGKEPWNQCCDADQAEEDAREAAMSDEELAAYIKRGERLVESAEDEAERRRALLRSRQVAAAMAPFDEAMASLKGLTIRG
jgi:hypothetical protein